MEKTSKKAGKRSEKPRFDWQKALPHYDLSMLNTMEVELGLDKSVKSVHAISAIVDHLSEQIETRRPDQLNRPSLFFLQRLHAAGGKALMSRLLADGRAEFGDGKKYIHLLRELITRGWVFLQSPGRGHGRKAITERVMLDPGLLVHLAPGLDGRIPQRRGGFRYLPKRKGDRHFAEEYVTVSEARNRLSLTLHYYSENHVRPLKNGAPPSRSLRELAEILTEADGQEEVGEFWTAMALATGLLSRNSAGYWTADHETADRLFTLRNEQFIRALLEGWIDGAPVCEYGWAPGWELTHGPWLEEKKGAAVNELVSPERLAAARRAVLTRLERICDEDPEFTLTDLMARIIMERGLEKEFRYSAVDGGQASRFIKGVRRAGRQKGVPATVKGRVTVAAGFVQSFLRVVLGNLGLLQMGHLLKSVELGLLGMGKMDWESFAVCRWNLAATEVMKGWSEQHDKGLSRLSGAVETDTRHEDEAQTEPTPSEDDAPPSSAGNRLPMVDRFILQPNFEILADTGVCSHRFLHRLQKIARLVKSDRVNQYELTRDKIVTAAHEQETPESILAFVSDHCAHTPPKNVMDEIELWLQRSELVRLYAKATVIECETEEEREAIFEHTEGMNAARFGNRSIIIGGGGLGPEGREKLKLNVRAMARIDYCVPATPSVELTGQAPALTLERKAESHDLLAEPIIRRFAEPIKNKPGIYRLTRESLLRARDEGLDWEDVTRWLSPRLDKAAREGVWEATVRGWLGEMSAVGKTELIAVTANSIAEAHIIKKIPTIAEHHIATVGRTILLNAKIGKKLESILEKTGIPMDTKIPCGVSTPSAGLAPSAPGLVKTSKQTFQGETSIDGLRARMEEVAGCAFYTLEHTMRSLEQISRTLAEHPAWLQNVHAEFDEMMLCLSQSLAQSAYIDQPRDESDVLEQIKRYQRQRKRLTRGRKKESTISIDWEDDEDDNEDPIRIDMGEIGALVEERFSGKRREKNLFKNPSLPEAEEALRRAMKEKAWIVIDHTTSMIDMGSVFGIVEDVTNEPGQPSQVKIRQRNGESRILKLAKIDSIEW